MRKLKLDELNRPTVEAYKSSADKLPLTVVLDNIRSALNVGSVFRTCDGLAISKLILVGIAARPPHKEINKTAIGATKSVEWIYHETIETALQELSLTHEIVGVEQTDDSVALQEYKIPERPLALVFGHEIEGVSDAALPYLDTAIEVPQFGTKHSLNVGVCAGIVLWEIAKQYRY